MFPKKKSQGNSNTRNYTKDFWHLEVLNFLPCLKNAFPHFIFVSFSCSREIKATGRGTCPQTKTGQVRHSAREWPCLQTEVRNSINARSITVCLLSLQFSIEPLFHTQSYPDVSHWSRVWCCQLPSTKPGIFQRSYIEQAGVPMTFLSYIIQLSMLWEREDLQFLIKWKPLLFLVTKSWMKTAVHITLPPASFGQ